MIIVEEEAFCLTGQHPGRSNAKGTINQKPLHAMATGTLPQQSITISNRLPKLTNLYNPTIPFSALALPCLILFLRYLPPPFSVSSYITNILYSLSSPANAVVSLAINSVLNNATHAFYPPPTGATTLRHLIVASSFISVFILHRRRVIQITAVRNLHAAAAGTSLMLLHSLTFSDLPLVSFLKSLLLFLAVTSIYKGLAGLTDKARNTVDFQILGICAVVSILSVPTIPFSMGYQRGAGLTGLLEHSQTFGIVTGLTASAYAAIAMTSPIRRKGSIAVSVACILLTYLSGARVGALAILSGVSAIAIHAVITLFLNSPDPSRRRQSRQIIIALAAALVVLLAATPLINDKITRFLTKYGSAAESTVADSLYSSRREMLDDLTYEIRRRPLTGAGLGTPTTRSENKEIIVDPIFGLPVMLAVEKGILPLVVIQELGFPLALLLYILLFFVLLRSAFIAGPFGFSLSIAALSVNLSESLLFSTGGTGLLVLVLLGIGTTPRHHISQVSPLRYITE